MPGSNPVLTLLPAQIDFASIMNRRIVDQAALVVLQFDADDAQFVGEFLEFVHFDIEFISECVNFIFRARQFDALSQTTRSFVAAGDVIDDA